MTLAWMVFGTLVSLAVLCGAEAAASALRLVAKPTRWVWGVAIAVVFALLAGAPFRAASRVMPAAHLSIEPSAAAPIAAPIAPSMMSRIATGATTSLRDLVQGAERLVSPRMSAYVLAAWLIVSSVLFLLLVAVYVRMRLARRAWPAIDVQGTAVRVSEHAGPAIMGLLHPEIVVPRWLLARASSEQRMALAHETEHLRARDHLLLACGSLAVVLLPWNPCVWWMFSRLRLAIELDCDARVLKQGMEPRSYGSLLIDLAEQSFGLRMGAPALVDGASHLQTRVMAMKKETHRFARVRGSIIGLAALSLVVVACEAKLPTSAEIDQMDVASAEKATTMAMAGSGNVRYQIDGVNATADQAHALRPDQIVAIDVAKGVSGDAAKVIYIRTVNGPRRVALQADTSAAAAEFRKTQGYAANVMAGDSAGKRVKIRGSQVQLADFTGLFIVDGKIVDPSTFGTLDPKDIDRIDVLKGRAAIAAYNDPRAANGVIKIELKKGTP
jgi:beta-lactamase regulating signal transducer with metallopeptidase domain